jgi:SAM-dependent methyltransferase
MSYTHRPVMLSEVLEYLDPSPGDVICDATCGGGGHSLEIARKIGESGVLIGIDLDPQALNAARQNLEGVPCRVILARGNYGDDDTLGHKPERPRIPSPYRFASGIPKSCVGALHAYSPPNVPRTFLAALSLALLDRGLLLTSSSVGPIGFLVKTSNTFFLPHTHTGNDGGHVHGRSALLKASFTTLSSRE